MHIAWWQEGVHIRPETQAEHEALVVLYRALENVKIGNPFANDRTGISESPPNPEEPQAALP